MILRLRRKQVATEALKHGKIKLCLYVTGQLVNPFLRRQIAAKNNFCASVLLWQIKLWRHAKVNTG